MAQRNTLVTTRFHRNGTVGDWWKLASSTWLVGSLVFTVCAAPAVATPPVTPVAIAADFTPLQSFFDNTLVCQDHDTKAVCHVWLNGDGSYYVFYDLGVQRKPAAIDGPFQFEGREGTYFLKEQAGGVEICLHPSIPVVALAAQRAHEFLSEAECYPLALHNVGARWQQADRRGREYTFWLMAGR